MYSSTAKSKASPDASYQTLHNMPFSQPRPPSSSGPPGRPTSASIRAPSSRKKHHQQEAPSVHSEDLPDKPAARPPSSFLKYRPLPAIGTPIPGDEMSITTHQMNTAKSSHIQPKLQHNPQLNSRRHETPQSSKKSNRVMAPRTSTELPNLPLMSNLSVSSTKTSCKSQITTDIKSSIEYVERLDLSQLDKSEGTWKRRTSHSDSSNRKSKTSIYRSQKDTSDLYDGDDDDSDSTQSPVSGYDSGIVIHNPGTSTSMKPVVIPSPENPPSREVLLAVKLPTDGTRHQKYFRSSDTLQAIIQFAEQKAGRSLHGYVLVVASAPKTVLVDLEDTIENAGLEDKTVFHLEEYEWED